MGDAIEKLRRIILTHFRVLKRHESIRRLSGLGEEDARVIAEDRRAPTGENIAGGSRHIHIRERGIIYSAHDMLALPVQEV